MKKRKFSEYDRRWLRRHGACRTGVDYAIAQLEKRGVYSLRAAWSLKRDGRREVMGSMLDTWRTQVLEIFRDLTNPYQHEGGSSVNCRACKWYNNFQPDNWVKITRTFKNPFAARPYKLRLR